MFRFTIRDLLWLMVVVSVAFAIYFARPQRVQWEYQDTTIQGALNKFDIDAKGKEGWELMHVDDKSSGVTTLYFKRRKLD